MYSQESEEGALIWDTLKLFPSGSLEGVGHLALGAREQVCVAECDVCRLMPHSVRDCHGREADSYERRDVAVAQVVHADHLNAGSRASAPHLAIESGLSKLREDPLAGRRLGDIADVAPYVVTQEPWNGYGAVGLLGLRRPDDVLSLPPVVGLVDGEGACGEVEVLGRERQELAFADARPIERLECVVDLRLVGDRVKEAVELALAPDPHLLVLGRSHLLQRSAWA